MPATFDPQTGTLTFTQGKYDTLVGITLQVAGEAYPRVRITPQGTVLTGDGTVAPVRQVRLTSPNGHVWEATIGNTGTVTWTDLDA